VTGLTAGHFHDHVVTTLSNLFMKWLTASVTKHYNLVQAEEWWCFVASKVTMGLMESDGSLPAGLW